MLMKINSMELAGKELIILSKADEIFDLEGFNKTYYTRQGTLTTKEIAEVIVYEYYNLENQIS